MNSKRIATFLIMGSFIMLLVLQCNGQSSGLKITQDQYNWNSDMKRLKVTTRERGLTFEIIILNQGNQPLTETSPLLIDVRVDSTTSGVYMSFFKQLQIDNLYLPANGNDTRYVNVDFGGGQTIGSYTAKLTYRFGSYSGQGQPIEEYPFDFRVMSEEELQKTINQNPSVPIINIYLPEITIFSGGGITVLALALWNRKRKKGK